MCRSSSVADLRRLSGAAGLLLLAACSGGEPDGAETGTDASDLISCAIGSATEFTRNCRVERAVDNGVLTLVVHHEDGGFRRLTVMEDGSGVTAVDGADQATIAVFDGEIEVAIGEDRYLLPATITGAGIGTGTGTPDAAE